MLFFYFILFHFFVLSFSTRVNATLSYAIIITKNITRRLWICIYMRNRWVYLDRWIRWLFLRVGGCISCLHCQFSRVSFEYIRGRYPKNFYFFFFFPIGILPLNKRVKFFSSFESSISPDLIHITIPRPWNSKCNNRFLLAMKKKEKKMGLRCYTPNTFLIYLQTGMIVLIRFPNVTYANLSYQQSIYLANKLKGCLLWIPSLCCPTETRISLYLEWSKDSGKLHKRAEDPFPMYLFPTTRAIRPIQPLPNFCHLESNLLC